MNDADGFLRAILADPDDEALRLVFADWLDEHGDPRGDFIRLQTGLEQLPLNDPRREEAEKREWVLLNAHGRTWAGVIPGMVRDYKFRRGFVEEIYLRAEQFLEHAPELFKTAPIRHALLYQAGPHMAELARCGWLTRLRVLDFKPEFSWRVNDYGATQIDDGQLSELAASPHLRNLRHLDLGWNHIGAGGLQRLVERAGYLPCLSFLDLSHNSIPGSGAVTALLDAPAWHGLNALCLGNNALGNECVAAFYKIARPAHLSIFRLEANGIGATGVESLAACPWLRNVELLSLHGNPLGTAVSQLVASPHLKSLKFLLLGSVDLGEAGVVELVKASWPRLTNLQLQYNHLGPAGAEALVRSSLLDHLEQIVLGDNRLGNDGVQALAACPKLASVQLLDLSHNQITNQGARALLESPYLENIVELKLRENDILPEVAAQLHQRFGHRLDIETFDVR